MVNWLHHLPNVKCLQRLNLYSLEDRRRRPDLIFAYGIFHGRYDRPQYVFFTLLSRSHLRGHGMKLRHHPFHLAGRKAVFAVGIVEPWNKLPLFVTTLAERVKSLVIPLVKVDHMSCRNSPGTMHPHNTEKQTIINGSGAIGSVLMILLCGGFMWLWISTCPTMFAKAIAAPLDIGIILEWGGVVCSGCVVLMNPARLIRWKPVNYSAGIIAGCCSMSITDANYK